MYMVKYGAETRGLVVPPLLGLNCAIGEVDGDTAAHPSLDATELAGLESHLKVNGGDSVSGGLSQMKRRKAHYLWVCCEHLRELYMSTLQQLRHSINAGGLWHGDEVKVKVTSEVMAKQFYDDLSKLFRIQSVDNWRSITEIDLELESHQLVSNSAMDTLNRLDDLESLSLDFGRFTMVARVISRGEIKDVAISIGDLSAPTLDDIEFIHQCRPTSLAVLGIPQVKDENRLVKFLQHNLANLRVGCHLKHFIAVIDLVKSTREKMLQSENKPALRVFELLHPEIKVKVSFEVGSPSFEVETHIKLEYCKPENVDPAVCTFIRQYGWSVTTFVVPSSFSDILAKLLDESVQEKGSRIAHLDMTPTSLTGPGLDAMNRVIDRSQGLTYLRLSLENLDKGQQQQNAVVLLRLHKDRLTSLRLVDSGLMSIANHFSRDSFPLLEEFFVMTSTYLDGACEWIRSMVSVPPRQQASLRSVGMGIYFWYKPYWEDVIKAIDLSALEELHFNSSGSSEGFREAQLKILVDHIAGSDIPSPSIRLLNLTEARLSSSTSMRELFARLREKVPEIKFVGVDA
ncbi:hypothetical protein BGX34_005765 [Mortierella sp. NVP85]|nr:hypothetical protein BGX34_005765 [Mortierella sp. NVP85]